MTSGGGQRFGTRTMGEQLIKREKSVDHSIFGADARSRLETLAEGLKLAKMGQRRRG